MLEITGDVLPIACFAVAGAFFAYSAGGHEVYAEQATSVTVRHHEEHLRNSNIIPAILFEGLATAQVLNIVRRKPRS